MSKIKQTLLLVFTLVLLFSLESCYKKGSASFLPLFAGDTKPYTYADLGLPVKIEDTKQASLPIISVEESEAIEIFLKEPSDQEILTDVGMKVQSVQGWKTIQFAKPSDNEIDDKIYRESIGQTDPEKVVGSKEELLATESAAADQFFGRIEADFPLLSINDLINIRKRLTLSLIVIRLEIDYGDRASGIPVEFLTMTRTKTVALRGKITEELLKRGVTKL